MLAFFKRIWSWWWTGDKIEPQHLTLVPEFDFKPTPEFRKFVGKDARFVVANPIDLIMQHQGLMTEMLVLEAHTAQDTVTLWLRYKSDELSADGTARCTIFVGFANQAFDGVCGQLRNRKRM